DLDVEAALLEHLDRVGDVLHDAAKLAVVFRVVGFEVDLVGIDKRPDEVEHLRGAVAVGNVGAAQAAGARFLEDIDGPFTGDEGLVVTGGDHGRAVLYSQIDQLRRRAESGRCRGVRVAQHLAGDPVLAVAAVIIAAEHAEGQGVTAGQNV